MSKLQRSAVSFRRQGSSGQIWNAATEFDEAAAPATEPTPCIDSTAATVPPYVQPVVAPARKPRGGFFAVLFTCMRPPPRTAATIPTQ
ncbi:hypothetical protein C4D60_Mb04t18540 [Musa balbisiana]|uniref:Uncharacterized protein n=1 Tax=Musa balbisiana TaxID=52838 RepID=A0A4V4H9U9_MUSBA|nr:hypothetical protein C4D60_Mb04t18540 [Musa balbisiana]